MERLSVEALAPARPRRWSRRRIAGSALGLAVVVGTGAVADASPDTVSHPAVGHPGAPASSTRFWLVADPADPSFSQALGVNDTGTVVGYSGSGADHRHPNRGWWAQPPATALHPVGYPGAAHTQVVGISADGTLAGFYVKRDGSNHGFVMQHGKYSTVDWPGTPSTKPVNQLLGISQKGLVAGFWIDTAGHSHGYLFDSRTRRFTPVRLPWAATSVTVTGVNDTGVVVGFALTGRTTVGFVLTGRTAVALRLGDGRSTRALGVNDAGTVAGSFRDGHGVTHGFIWASGHARTVDVPWHARHTVVNGISSTGQLVGYFTDGARTRGFVTAS